MPGKYIQPSLIEQIRALLASREGRSFLTSNSWVEGMPIITGKAHESLETTMGLLSLHQRPALIAVAEPESEDLRLLYVSDLSRALQIVPCLPKHFSLWDLFKTADLAGLLTFRVKQWKFSRMAHALPFFNPYQTSTVGAYRPELAR